MRISYLAIGGVIATAIIWTLWLSAPVRTNSNVLADVIPKSRPDQPGWLDDQPLTDADRRRIGEISGFPDANNTGHLAVIRSIQGGVQSSLTRRDFELLRQDRRRAMAAYPEIDFHDLTQGLWVQVDLAAKIPVEWKLSSNADSSQGPDGKWYYDGGLYVSKVATQYPNRASAADTKAYFAGRAKKKAEAKLARDHISWSVGGSGGSLSVMCEGGTCTVRQSDEWAAKGRVYVFPFVAAEWVDDPNSMDAIKKLPSFVKARISEETVTPSGVTISGASITGESGSVRYSPGMTLMPGQTTEIGITVGKPNLPGGTR